MSVSHPSGSGVGALARAATRTLLVGGVYAGAMAALETVLPGHGHEGAGALAATVGAASTAVLHKVDHLLGHLFGHQLVAAVFPHESGPPTRSGLNHDIEHTFATAAAQAVVALMGEWEKKIPASQRAIDSGQWELDDLRTACTAFLAGEPGAAIPDPIAAWLTALGERDILEHGGLATAPDTAAMPAHPCTFYAYFDWRFPALFQHLFTEQLLTHDPARHKFALLIQRHVIARLDQLADGLAGLKTQLTALAQRIQPGEAQWDASFTAQLRTVAEEVRALSTQQAARFDRVDAQLDRIVTATAPLHGALPAIREFLTTSGQSAGQLTAVRGEVRGSRRSILAVLAGGIFLLLSLWWWVKKDAAQTGQTVSRVEEKVDTQQQTAARTEEKVDVLLAAMRGVPGALGRQAKGQNPQDAAARLAAAYAELEAELHLPPGTLAKELPKFAEQLLQRADTSALDRANALFVTKKFAEAEVAFVQAKDQALAAAGQPVHDAITALEGAGNAAREQIHYPQALDHFRAAAALTDENRDPREWARVQVMIAYVLQVDGKYHDAELILWHAVEVRQRVLGEQHPDTLGSRNNLATALRAQGKYGEAEREHRAVLAVMERVLGVEHPDTLMSRNNLANALQAQGKYGEAEREQRAVLAIKERVLGAEHPYTLSSRNNLAVALQAQGKYAAAEQEHRARIAIEEHVLGVEHPDTLASRNNLATVLQAQGKYAEAEREHRAVLAIRERVLGVEHPETLTSRNNLANALQAQRKYGEAEREHRARIAIEERVLGAEHPDVLVSCNNLALCLEDQKKLPEALAFMQRAETGLEKVLGTEHPDAKNAKAARERIEAALAQKKVEGSGGKKGGK